MEKNWKKIAKKYKKQLQKKNREIKEINIDLDRTRIVVRDQVLTIEDLSKRKDFDSKLEVVLSKIDDVMKNEGFAFYQPACKFLSDYNEVLKEGGTALEQFAVKQIEKAKQERSEARELQHKAEWEYEKLMKKVDEFTKISNSLSLLKPTIEIKEIELSSDKREAL